MMTKRARWGWNKSGAFTLIELLIVIAIILILIAIALPNFLSAQIRAKVARGNMDMHALQVALESYRNDWPTYPPSYHVVHQGQGWWINTWRKRLEVLTTPHEYLTSLPIDPFFSPLIQGKPQYIPDAAVHPEDWETYSYAEDYYGLYPYPPNDRRGLVNPWGNDVTYHLTGLGPDGLLNFQQSSEDLGSGLWDPDVYLPWLMKMYNPTNGTRSTGDVLVWGGASTGGCQGAQHPDNPTPNTCN